MKKAFEIDVEDAWKLMELLDSYQNYRSRFSIDVLKLLKQGKSPQEIMDLILENKLKQIKNED